MAGFAETLEAAFGSALIVAEQVARDPESPDATTSVAEMAQYLDRFMTSREFAALLRADPAQRLGLADQISPAAQRVFGILRETLSVALQIQQLGGHVEWAADLERASDRFARVFARLGVALPPPSLPVPPMVTRTDSPDGSSRFRVVPERVRRPQLEPYIALALRRALVSESAPGHWFAELEGFRGVWADGPSQEACLAALADVLHEWLIVKTAQGDSDLPIIGNLDPRMLILLG